jgi:NADPH:quinone reductase-like Zn-dependent oxidoreductase
MSNMQAVAVNQYGAKPTVMQLPKPEPGPGQILLRIRAAGMNPMDRQISDGGWKGRMPGMFPLVLGSDLAAVVEGVGENTSRFSPGDAVFGQLLIPPLGSAGTYAQYVAVVEDANLALMPQKIVDPEVAAALPTAGVTAMEIIQSLGQLAGKRVLIIGAGGGVGSFATQFAAHAGAHVDAIAHADAEARMRRYGAAESFDHTEGSMLDAVRRAHPDGVDILIDTASDRDGFAAAASLVRRGGIALTTTYVSDDERLGRAGITGANFQSAVSPDALQQIADEVVSGHIMAPPLRRLGLDEVPATWGSGHFDGKTVIVP